MEIDPDFEYDAPKWFDFTAYQENDLSLDDSWFEKVHPLHEPKDPSHHDATKKPLLASNHNNKTASTDSKWGKSKPFKKNYNSKKSLGIKTVRTRRGQHESSNKAESMGKSFEDQKPKKHEPDSKGSHGVSKEETVQEGSPVGMNQHMEGKTTLSWQNSLLNKTGDTFVCPKKDREGSNCSLTDMTVFSPRRVPVNLQCPDVISPASPARIRCLNALSGSSPTPSPNNALLVKAVGDTNVKPVQKKRRRLLPAIPDVKATSVASPVNFHSDDGNEPVDHSKPTREGCLSNHTMASNEVDKPLRTQDTQGAESLKDKEVDIGKPWIDDNINAREANSFSKRSLGVIPEQSNVKGNGCQSLVPGESTILHENKSIEELLKEHNKKIIAARNQYDENGRKIRTAMPSFCPAPPQNKASSSLSAASKRPTSSLDKPSATAKQKRRSCVAAVSDGCSETDLRAQSTMSNSSGNRNGKDAFGKPAAKQKRRSCAAVLQSRGQVTLNAEKELRDLIAQHNSRVTGKRA